MESKAKWVVLLAYGLIISVTGALFFTDRPFYWFGEVLSERAMIIIGLTLIVTGVLLAFRAGWVQSNGGPR